MFNANPVEWALWVCREWVKTINTPEHASTVHNVELETAWFGILIPLSIAPWTSRPCSGLPPPDRGFLFCTLILSFYRFIFSYNVDMYWLQNRGHTLLTSYINIF